MVTVAAMILAMAVLMGVVFVDDVGGCGRNDNGGVSFA